MSTAIIDRGRGPEIAGTRITVFDVLDYAREGWNEKGIAVVLGLSSDQVRAARRYIEEHQAEVMAAYQSILERNARGNPPEVRAKLDAARAKLKAMLHEETTTHRGHGHAGPPG